MRYSIERIVKCDGPGCRFHLDAECPKLELEYVQASIQLLVECAQEILDDGRSEN